MTDRHPVSRRSFLSAVPAVAGALAVRPAGGVEARPGGDAPRRAAAPALAAPKATDVRVESVRHRFEDFRYRTPMKFGGREVDRVTLLHVDVQVRTRDGRIGRGFGSMPLGNVWAYPSRELPFERTLGAMQALAERLTPAVGAYPDFGHPFEILTALEPAFLAAAAELSKTLAEPIPKLAVLVTASPFDAAVHDAYGKVHNRTVYATYGPDFCNRDLGDFLGPAFAGEYADRYVSVAPKPRLAIFHAVGASDPLDASDPFTRINDGLPETLAEWVPREGLDHFKIKMNGNDAAWDVARVLGVERVVAATRGPARDWQYSLDFNERCPNVEYLLDVVQRIRRGSAPAFERILFLEQPTARDLEADRHNVMHEAAKLRPVVIDESLTGLDMLTLAREMGYTGVALKACKGQTPTMLMAAAARKHGMFLSVQDLTCPGAAYVQSLGIAARMPGVTGLEANARQYVPSASAAWACAFPALFTVRNGGVDTSGLVGPGLGLRAGGVRPC